MMSVRRLARKGFTLVELLVVITIILLISTLVIVVNVIVDVLYGAINPRIRHG